LCRVSDCVSEHIEEADRVDRVHTAERVLRKETLSLSLIAAMLLSVISLRPSISLSVAVSAFSFCLSVSLSLCLSVAVSVSVSVAVSVVSPSYKDSCDVLVQHALNDGGGVANGSRAVLSEDGGDTTRV
jgi:hypothetical protein